MRRFVFNVDWNGTPAVIEISEVGGRGTESWDIMFNNYYHGCFILTADGWVVHLNPNSPLTPDEIQILREYIESVN
jgi:hypothetical protein